MKKAIFLAAALLMAGAGAAERLVPLPSVADYTRGGGWGLAIGGQVEYESAYDGSEEYAWEGEPAGAIQWRKDDTLWFVEGQEAGVRSLAGPDMLLQASARYETGREAGDSEDGYLNGLDDRDDAILGALEMRWTRDKWQNWLGARAMGGETGLMGLVAAGRRIGELNEIFLYSSFADEKFNNRDFGVTNAEITRIGNVNAQARGLFAYDAGSGYRSSGVTWVHRQQLNHYVQLLATGGAEFYGENLTDSPLARKDYEVEAAVTVLFVF